MEQNNSEKQIKKICNQLRMCLNRLKISQYWLFVVLRHLAKNCKINGKGMPLFLTRGKSLSRKKAFISSGYITAFSHWGWCCEIFEVSNWKYLSQTGNMNIWFNFCFFSFFRLQSQWTGTMSCPQHISSSSWYTYINMCLIVHFHIPFLSPQNFCFTHCTG